MKLQNRVLAAFKAWEDQKTELQALLKAGAADERTLNMLQLSHLRQAKHRLDNTARPDEQPFMPLLSTHIARLEKKLYPNTLQRWFYQLKNHFFDGPAYIRREEQQRSLNMENLKAQLAEAGLSSIGGRLEKHLDPDLHQVRLPLNCQLDGERKLNINLHFEKDAVGDFQLVRLGGSLMQNGQKIKTHDFELADWPGLRSNQVLSLLEGRALKQHYTDTTGQQNERWVELGAQGVQHYEPGQGLDVKTALADMPQITGSKPEMTRYIENGQRAPAHWKVDRHYQRIYVQADPANHALKILDEKGRMITPEKLNQNARQKSAKVITLGEQPAKKRIRNGQHI